MNRRRASLLLAISALALVSTNAQAASPLIGSWPLDAAHEEDASQVTADVSGNGLDLRAPNGAMHLGAPALFGTGATLATDLTPLQVTSPLLAPARLTLLAWVKQSGNPGTLRYIAGRGDDALTCGGSSYALYTGYPGMGGLRFYVRHGAGDSSLTPAPADAAVFDGRWHLVAGTYDGAAARLYVDGSLVGAPVPAPSPLNYALGGASSFYVDGYPVEGCALFGNADDWPGAIDEVRLYDRALSPAELGRLAAATGPAAPALVTDASLVPAPGGATPPPAPAPGPALPNALAELQAVRGQALAQAAAGLAGASKRDPSAAAQAALEKLQAQALEIMRNAGGSSLVAPPRPAQGLTAQQAKKTTPDPRVQDRLEAMRYGLAAQIPTAAPGHAVEAVATIALEKQRNGKVTTQTITLPPAVGVAKPGSTQAQVPFAVDAKASAAMAKSDIARASVAVQAVDIDTLSELSQTEQLRLQMLMDRRSKTMETLSNTLKKLSDTQQAITQNLKGGVTGSERQEQKDLTGKAAKLDQQIKALERQRDETSQKAAQATQQAVTELVNGLASAAGQALSAGAGFSGSVPPSASTALSGCTTCRLAAAASK